MAALDNGVKMAVLCWARRAGKDFTCFAYAVKKMIETPMNVVLVFPTKEQGKNAFWENVENDGMKTLDHIPESLRAGTDNGNMRIKLANGSTFQLLGATDPDSLRGANGKLYIFSEFVDIPSGALKVIRPIVRNNGGQIIIQSTPKIDGISGGTFKIIFDRALKNWSNGAKTQYASLITASRYLSPADMEEARQEAIEENGNDFFYRQEYLCDWGQSSSSSYYGQVLQELKKRDMIGEFPYNPAYRVYTAWDLGMADSTAVTFFQYYNRQAHIIDYYESHDISDEAHVNFLKTKPYVYTWHFFPHDGSKRDSDAIQRIEKIRKLGLTNSSLLRRHSVEDGIKAAVTGLRQATFNDDTTKDLRRKLILYKRKFNGLTGDYLGPEHKTESHAADSIRYMFEALDQDFNPKTGEFLYSPAQVQSSYSGDEIASPTAYMPTY